MRTLYLFSHFWSIFPSKTPLTIYGTYSVFTAVGRPRRRQMARWRFIRVNKVRFTEVWRRFTIGVRASSGRWLVSPLQPARRYSPKLNLRIALLPSHFSGLSEFPAAKHDTHPLLADRAHSMQFRLSGVQLSTWRGSFLPIDAPLLWK